MALPVKQQATYWGIASAVFLVLMWFLGDVILPFILGAAVAYFLDPVADRLQRLGLSRMAAVVVIALGLILLVTLVMLLVVPTLVGQAVALFEIMPQLISDLRAFLIMHVPSLIEPDSTAHETLTQLGETIRERGVAMIETLVTSAASLLNIVVILVVAPVVAIYLLYD